MDDAEEDEYIDGDDYDFESPLSSSGSEGEDEE